MTQGPMLPPSLDRFRLVAAVIAVVILFGTLVILWRIRSH